MTRPTKNNTSGMHCNSILYGGELMQQDRGESNRLKYEVVGTGPSSLHWFGVSWREYFLLYVNVATLVLTILRTRRSLILLTITRTCHVCRFFFVSPSKRPRSFLYSQLCRDISSRS